MARKRARPSLWGIRTPIPSGLGRVLSISSVALVFVAWAICSYVTVDRGKGPEPLVPHFFLPPPDEVVKSLLYLLFEKGLLSAVVVSALRIFKAFALAAAIALPLGVLMGSFESVNKFFDPILAPFRYIPVTVFIPLTILWFGFSESQKIGFLFLGMFAYLVASVVDAVKGVPEELVQTALTLGASRAQVIRTVLVPAALPQIFDSFRVMNAIAWTYIILAEIVGVQESSGGIGYLLHLAERLTKPAWSFAGIVVVGVIGIGTDLFIRGVNRLLFSWREADA